MARVQLCVCVCVCVCSLMACLFYHLSGGLFGRLSKGFSDGLFNPFIAPTCKISGLKDVRTRLQNSKFSSPVTLLLSILCAVMKVLSHASAKRKRKGLRVSSFTLSLVIFK